MKQKQKMVGKLTQKAHIGLLMNMVTKKGFGKFRTLTFLYALHTLRHGIKEHTKEENQI